MIQVGGSASQHWYGSPRLGFCREYGWKVEKFTNFWKIKPRSDNSAEVRKTHNISSETVHCVIVGQNGLKAYLRQAEGRASRSEARPEAASFSNWSPAGGPYVYSTRTGHLPEALTCIRPEVYSSPNFVRSNRHLWIQGVGKGNTREKRVW